jgi:hypothetical protein
MVRPPTDPILDIVPADPAIRRIALIGWGTIAALGGGVIWYVSRVLSEAQAMSIYDPRTAFLEAQRIVIPVVIVGALVGVCIAVYCLIAGAQVIRAGRFPAPGARLITATPIRRGVAAHRVGIVMVILSLMMLAASIAFPIFLRRVMQAIEQSDERFRPTPPDQLPASAAPAARR